MDPFIAILRRLADNGWRAGLALLVFGAAVLIADHFRFPSPGMFEAWISASALAMFAGAAIVATSIASNLVETIGRARARARNKESARLEQIEEAEAALSNLETLRGAELSFLYAALRGPQRRFEVHRVSEAYSLIPKHVLVVVGDGDGLSWICELHPAVLSQRDRILPVLKEIVEGGDPFAGLTRQPAG